MPSPVEVWTSGAGRPSDAAARARRLEDEGWDGFGVVDSQNLAGDPYVALTMAATATTRLRLATAVTNPVTRHPALAATSAATVQAESGGRFVLGIGRGDSALAHLGLAPASPSQFDHYLARLQGYLRRDEVPFDLDTDLRPGLAPSSTLQMSGGPTASRLRWLRDANPKVPVDVAASGPKVIDIAGRLADAVTFAVGVDPDRLRWAVGVAHDACRSVGRDPAELGLGAYVPVLVHPDRGEARRMISGGIGSYARFSVMHGTVAGPVGDDQRRTLEAVHAAYDMNAHFTHGSPQSKALTDEVIDAFAVAGPASYCVERIEELIGLGIRRIFVHGPGRGLDIEDATAAHERLVAEVLPKLSGRVGS
ncbi:MAG: LLM class flavin-dependent oxidoreductase [Actinomycetota bacterium]|nr:LLM class flavin-dependent oxidoreductase [Actinomycetota bacterium]